MSTPRCGTVLAFGAAILLAMFIAVELRGQEQVQQPLLSTPEQVKAAIKATEAEITRLRDAADAPDAWKELRRIETQLNAMKTQRAKEQEPLNQKLFELSQSKAVRDWEQRIDAHSARLRDLNQLQYDLTKEAGRKLAQARHADLSRLATPATPRLHELNFDVLSYPRMDGSTSTQPLAAVIACRCLGAKYAWFGREPALPRTRRLDPTLPHSDLELYLPSFRTEPELRLLEFTLRARADVAAENRLAIIINSLLASNASTNQAYVNLIEGTSDIGLLARRPSAAEAELAQSKGVRLDTVPCALDAFVFLVHQANRVHNLSTGQIREIYSGRVKNWQQVGGSAADITAYKREENSGSQELMRSLVMKTVPLEKPTGAYQSAPQLIGYLMTGIFLNLARDESGIGYSVYYYEHYMSGSATTRVIAVDGVEPTYESISSRKYPFVSEVFVVTRADLPPEASARRLRDWLLSAEGQAVVRESGYVPLTARER